MDPRREEQRDGFSAVNLPPPPPSTGDQPPNSTESLALIHPYNTVIPLPYNPTSVPLPYVPYHMFNPTAVPLPYNIAIPPPQNTYNYYTYSAVPPPPPPPPPPPGHNRFEVRHRHPSRGQHSSNLIELDDGFQPQQQPQARRQPSSTFSDAHDGYPTQRQPYSTVNRESSDYGTQTPQHFQTQGQESSTINGDRRFCDDMYKIGGIALAISLSLYGIMATLMGQYSGEDSFMRQHMIAVGISVLVLFYCCASGIAVLIIYLRATEDPGNRSYVRYLILSCLYCAFVAPLLLGVKVFVHEDAQPVFYLVMCMISIAVYNTCFSLSM